jgi:hypothetical protein
MAAVKIKPPKHFNCRQYREHMRQRIDERTFLRPMAEELDVWLKSGPWAVDLEESPSGWHKHFGSFTVLGEGECIKTVFTIYAPGNPRPQSVDLDEWEKRRGKPVSPVPRP